MRVYVHAWEYVNGPNDAGGGGFDWYWEPQTANSAYTHARMGISVAHFRFDVDVAETDDRDAITDEIDGQLIDLTAAASIRKVGRDVLAYWQANGMKMGDATSPAAPELSGDEIDRATGGFGTPDYGDL